MEGVLLAFLSAGFVILAVLLSARHNRNIRRQEATTGRSVPLNMRLIEAAENDTNSHPRSVAEKIERWAHIGRICELRSDFDYDNVAEALRADVSPAHLSLMERTVYDAEFEERMKYAGPDEEALHARQTQKVEHSSFDGSDRNA